MTDAQREQCVAELAEAFGRNPSRRVLLLGICERHGARGRVAETLIRLARQRFTEAVLSVSREEHIRQAVAVYTQIINDPATPPKLRRRAERQLAQLDTSSLRGGGEK